MTEDGTPEELEDELAAKLERLQTLKKIKIDDKLELAIEAYESEIEVRDFLGNPVTSDEIVSINISESVQPLVDEKGQILAGYYDDLNGADDIVVGPDRRDNTVDHETAHRNADARASYDAGLCRLHEGLDILLMHKMHEGDEENPPYYSDEQLAHEVGGGEDGIFAGDRLGYQKALYLEKSLLQAGYSEDETLEMLKGLFQDPSLLDEVCDRAGLDPNAFVTAPSKNQVTQTIEQAECGIASEEEELEGATVLAAELAESLEEVGYDPDEVREMMEDLAIHPDRADLYVGLAGMDSDLPSPADRDSHEDEHSDRDGKTSANRDTADELAAEAPRAAHDLDEDRADEPAGLYPEATESQLEHWAAEDALPDESLEERDETEREEPARESADVLNRESDELPVENGSTDRSVAELREDQPFEPDDLDEAPGSGESGGQVAESDSDWQLEPADGDEAAPRVEHGLEAEGADSDWELEPVDDERGSRGELDD
ncbi:MAG: hypothetical protein FJ276_34485, partial [Planctomycetes bacterium]|nr:hypothetical protein [Planctomycetota bacterium]